jgi:uncharacterized phage protein (TIGR01671 family)
MQQHKQGIDKVREIKFRAYDRNNKKMLPVGRIFQYYEQYVGGIYMPTMLEAEMANGEPVMYDLGRPFLMQYTGLKDKNGVEIYEGDIVEFKISGSRYIAEVYYDTATARYSKRGVDSSHGGAIDKDLVSYTSTQKVVGNVYEHPELLKAGDA